MLEELGQLREAEQFWPWLYKIALNEIRLNHRNQQHNKTVSDPDTSTNHNHNDSREVIAGVVYDEFREIVFAAMRELKPEHRSVINMRCYDKCSMMKLQRRWDAVILLFKSCSTGQKCR